MPRQRCRLFTPQLIALRFPTWKNAMLIIQIEDLNPTSSVNVPGFHSIKLTLRQSQSTPNQVKLYTSH